jgi:uncharacterized protein (UPF0212 family)
MSSTARNCPHCGWHKSQAGTVAAWIIALVILALVALFSYQINEANKAEANAKKELNKSDAMIKALESPSSSGD